MRYVFSSRRLDASGEDRSLWHRFRSNLSIGLLGTGLTLAIRLGQAVLLTAFLRMEDYGRVLIVLNLFVFLEAFIGLRLSDVVLRFYPPLEEQRDERALQGLLLVCLGIGLATGLLICAGVFVSSPWLAGHLYRQPELAPLFRIYGSTFLVSAFGGVYEPILRIHDRFAAVVVPQVLGGLTGITILIAHLGTTDGYDPKVVVTALAIGVLVQTLPPLAHALRLMQPALRRIELGAAGRALARHRPELLACLFHSNLSGYLRLTVSPGDIFVLGLLSPPGQVALYGLARQLAAPPVILHANIQSAITPAVTSLLARGKLVQLERLVVRCVASAFVLGGLAVGGALLLGHLFVSWLARPEYIAALPVSYPLLVAAWLLMTFLVFRPLAVSLDLMRWHNLALLASTAVLLFFAVGGGVNATTMAYAQLAGALIVRPLFNIPVWLRLRTLVVSSSSPDEPSPTRGAPAR